MGAQKAEEITVRAPNEVGTMGKVFGVIAKAGANVKSFVAWSEGNQGIFKLITSDNAKIAGLMESEGFSVERTAVVAVTCSDAIGAGADLGTKLGEAGISIDYAYATGTGGGEAVVVFSVDDVDKAAGALG